jgi:hypothetical protein
MSFSDLIRRVQALTVLAIFVGCAVVIGCGGHGVLPPPAPESFSGQSISLSPSSGLVGVAVMRYSQVRGLSPLLYFGPKCTDRGALLNYFTLYPGGQTVTTQAVVPSDEPTGGQWSLPATPIPLPSGWIQLGTPPPPTGRVATIKWSVASDAAVGSQLCVVESYFFNVPRNQTDYWLALITVVPPLQIYDINKQLVVEGSPGAGPNAVVGGQIGVKAQAIDGSQVSSVVWTIPASPIKDYQLANGGTPQPLTTTDLHSNPVKFYWISPGSNTIGLTATLTKNGASKNWSASGSYTVNAPLITQMDAVATPSVNLGQYDTSTAAPSLSLGTIINLPPTAGMKFTFTMITPTDVDNVYLGITQFINTNMSLSPDPKLLPTLAPLPTTPPLPTYYLDSCALELISPDGKSYQTAPLPAGGTYATFQTVDSPGVGPLSLKALSYTIPEHFKSYYMFKPAPGGSGHYPKTIWVALGRLAWSWSGTATRTSANAWLGPSSSQVPGAGLQATATQEIPVWLKGQVYNAGGSGCPPVP